MSARRYPTAELYEERQRDYSRNGARTERSYDELDIDVQRGNPRRSAPDFLREDYGRTSAGPLVVRDRVTEEVRGPPRRREVKEDTLVIRGGRGPPSREVERDDITIRREERERPRPREVEETDITIKHRDSSRPRPREVRGREVDREEITFRRGGRPPPEREVEREDITFTRRERPPPPREVERDEISFRREESRGGREREVERDSLVIRNRERSLPPPRELVAREREEFLVRRREPPREETVKDEIIIRRMEQRSPTPPPPPEPEAIIRPPIIQEVITHHRHIDHGIERARSPTPPPPPSPPRDDSLEISIRRKESRGDGGGNREIIYERETVERKEDDWEVDRTTRRRSYSAPRRRFTVHNDDLEEEADYYNRKVAERAYIGEAYNGATKDWAIVDVPPGTNRVRMEGQGGGAQEVTWQRYNGVRRSKFIAGDEEISSGFGAPAPSNPKAKDMWTEITKDLVLKEAIDIMGFDYEETDDFFYVMEYLRYEDVLQLVELSGDIRRKRQSRIRQIDYEREEIRRPKYEDRFYEHEFSYDSRRRRY